MDKLKYMGNMITYQTNKSENGGCRMITFTIPGQPQAKARVRFKRIGNFTRAYTPEQTVSYENYIKTLYIHEVSGPIHDGAIQINVLAYYDIPKSTSKTKREAMLNGDIRPTKKPDLSNIVKVVEDALNGIAYKDDSQIVQIISQKFYSDSPRVSVAIQEVQG